MKKSKTLLTHLFTIILILSFEITIPANVTKSDAVSITKKYVPSGCKLTEVSYDKKKAQWECEFLTKDRSIEYEIKIDAFTGSLKKKEMEKRFDKGGRCTRITKKAARKAVAKLFKDAVITKVKKCMDDGFYIYRVWFHGSTYTGNAEVNASTGKVNEWTKYY